MNKNLGMLVLLIVIFVVTTLFQNRFVDDLNITNLINWTSLSAIMGIGVAFVIITGGIDLSIGSMVALVGCLLGIFISEDVGMHPAAAIICVLGISMLIGLTYGLLITQLKLQPFVVTLCGLLILRGLARFIANDQKIPSASLGYLSQHKLVHIPIPFISWISDGYWGMYKWNNTNNEYPLDDAGEKIALPLFQWVSILPPFFYLLVIAIIAAIFLNKTVWGRYLMALGKNEQAAKFSGINTNMMTILAYVICSLLAGVAGVLFAVNMPSVDPGSHGNFYELYAIAAAVLGGCSLRGGEGSIFGVLIGSAILSVLRNSIEFLGIRQLEFAVIGSVILAGVIFDEVTRKVMARRRAIQEAAMAETSVVGPLDDAPNPSG
ncbi:MAG: sugar ABC transporter permease [Blastopirellula sp.]|nr:MAG: sugar ABC transporter permease [Blastopirellula sp.]